MKSILAAVAAAAFCARAQAKEIVLTVYHTNDVHGWVMARPASQDLGPWAGDRLIGGYAALSSFLKRQPIEGRLALDAGDWFQGTPEGDADYGALLPDLMNAIPYDAVEPGNHDFDFGRPNFERLAGRLRAPVLGANIIGASGRAPAFIKPWIIKEVSGVKVGIFGLLTSNMRRLSLPQFYDDYQFLPEAEAARKAVDELKARGATVIIAVTHVGYEDDRTTLPGDQTVAREVPGIDLIVGGHTHTFIAHPQHEPTHGTLIVQAGRWLTDVGIATLRVDSRTGRVVSSKGRLKRLWIDEIGEAPDVLKLVQAAQRRASGVYDVVVATAAAALRRDAVAESALGDWVADCLRAWAGSDVAIQNGGGLRGNMAPGPVTVREIFEIVPFDNRMATMTMTGRLLREAFDHGVGKDKPHVMQVSGAAMRYDRDARAGERVSGVEIGGKPLDDEASYKVATLDFLAKGGEGYSPFVRAAGVALTPTLERDVLIDCARREGTIVPPQAGRLIAAAAGGRSGSGGQ